MLSLKDFFHKSWGFRKRVAKIDVQPSFHKHGNSEAVRVEIAAQGIIQPSFYLLSKPSAACGRLVPAPFAPDYPDQLPSHSAIYEDVQDYPYVNPTDLALA